MPKTQPSKEAMANNLAIRWHDDPGYGCVAACTAEYCPIVKEITGELAAALEAYAAERVARVFRERDEHSWRGEAADETPYLQAIEQRDFAVARAESTERAIAIVHDSNQLCRARAETAEAESARWKAQFESTNAAGIGVVEKLAVAEERVRMLEDIEEALTSMSKSHPKTAALLLRDALGRSKGARRDLDRGSSAFVSNQRAVPPCGEDA